MLHSIRLLGVEYAALPERVLAGGSDDNVLVRCHKRGWRDEHRTFFCKSFRVRRLH